MEKIIETPIEWKNPSDEIESGFDPVTKDSMIAAIGDMHPPPLKQRSKRPTTVSSTIPAIATNMNGHNMSSTWNKTWFLRDWEVSIHLC